MIKLYLILILTFMSHSAAHADNWICKEEASIQNGNEIRSCGIGISKDESSARIEALNRAKDEFDHICNLSDGCKNHEVRSEPQRMTCESVGDSIKCYRMVTFRIGPEVHPSKSFDQNAIQSYLAQNDSHRIFLDCDPRCNATDKSGCHGIGSIYRSNHCR